MRSTKKYKIGILASLSFLLALSPCMAEADVNGDIAKIKSRLESNVPPIKSKSIKLSPILGLYEVFDGNSIFYTDKDFKYAIVNGSIIDTSKKKNLTEESTKKLTQINFELLPFDNAIQIKKGTGAYKFAIFTDPDCPYCKNLEKIIAKSDATDYTAYVFLYPLNELHPNSLIISEHIWCASDKVGAWNNFMLNGVAPAESSCDNPLKSNRELAELIGVAGTPTIYANDGQLLQDIEDLLALLKNNKEK